MHNARTMHIRTIWHGIGLWFEAAIQKMDRSEWHRKPLGVFLLYLLIVLLAFWGIKTPSPGEAVAVLAVAAAVMTVLGEMKGKEKVAWLLLLFGFLWVELTSIKVERKAQDDIQKEARAEQLKHFGEIGDGIKQSIAESDRNFNATMGKSNQVIGLQTTTIVGLNTNLKTLTGADSFCYLGFTVGQQYLPFIHVGKFPLYGIYARIVELDQNGGVSQNNLTGVTISVGDMITGHGNLQPVPIGLGRSPDYFNANIFFTARNGDWMELLRERRVGGKLVRAMRVTGKFTSFKKEKALCETIDPEFPRKLNGDIDSDFFSSSTELPRCQ